MQKRFLYSVLVMGLAVLSINCGGGVNPPASTNTTATSSTRPAIIPASELKNCDELKAETKRQMTAQWGQGGWAKECPACFDALAAYFVGASGSENSFVQIARMVEGDQSSPAISLKGAEKGDAKVAAEKIIAAAQSPAGVQDVYKRTLNECGTPADFLELFITSYEGVTCDPKAAKSHLDWIVKLNPEDAVSAYLAYTKNKDNQQARIWALTNLLFIQKANDFARISFRACYGEDKEKFFEILKEVITENDGFAKAKKAKAERLQREKAAASAPVA